MRKRNLIVFDIDDTLTKSEDQHQQAYIDAMMQFGIEKIDQNWENYKNVTDSYILKENYEANFGKDFSFSLIPEFEEIMTGLMLQLPQSECIKGAEKVVNFFMRETDYAICFATGSLLAPALIKLEQANINFVPNLVEASNAIYTREDIVRSAMGKAKEYFQVDAFDTIISVGDGIWDLKTARNLGVHFLGIRNKSLPAFQKENINSHITDWSDFDFEKIQLELGIKP